jgi:hypothetical protein
MEHAEREMILQAVKTNVALGRLYAEHERLDEVLSDLGRRRFLTVEEEVESKKLKLKKLRGVERMMAMLAEDRPQAP